MRTCQKCRVRKPDYEFPRKRGRKMGIQVVCKKCKEERLKKKIAQFSEFQRNRLVMINKRKRYRVTDPVFQSFTLKASLYKKVNEHVKKFGYPSKAAFFRDALRQQLRAKETIFDDLQKRPDMIQYCGIFSKLTIEKMLFSTAISDYTSFSDFMRTTIKNKIEWECSNDYHQ